jgi:hypothetical protein
MEDYNNIPFKNASIDRLTSMTTPPPIERSYSNPGKSNPTPRMIAEQKAKERSAEYISSLKEKTKKAPRNAGLEYEPKVRKRHMKP